MWDLVALSLSIHTVRGGFLFPYVGLSPPSDTVIHLFLGPFYSLMWDSNLLDLLFKRLEERLKLSIPLCGIRRRGRRLRGMLGRRLSIPLCGISVLLGMPSLGCLGLRLSIPLCGINNCKNCKKYARVPDFLFPYVGLITLGWYNGRAHKTLSIPLCGITVVPSPQASGTSPFYSLMWDFRTLEFTGGTRVQCKLSIPLCGIRGLFFCFSCCLFCLFLFMFCVFFVLDALVLRVLQG